MDFEDRYGRDVLAGDWRGNGRQIPTVPAVRDLVVEHADDGYTGAIVAVDKLTVQLEDWKGRVRSFPLDASFLIDGEPVRLAVPTAAPAPTGPKRTASGSFAVAGATARVARQGRILVEGRHDAELVEKVWGDDLRIEGVVVEYLGGIDHLAGWLDEFRPGPDSRVGVLVDHLVPGSKESRLAEAVARGRHAAHAIVVGHPFIDVWQSIRPSVLGIEAWPNIPRGIDWKHGICEAFGWPHEDQADIAAAWQRLLGRVRGYTDLEPSLLGRVEQLIDFVTAPDEG